MNSNSKKRSIVTEDVNGSYFSILVFTCAAWKWHASSALLPIYLVRAGALNFVLELKGASRHQRSLLSLLVISQRVVTPKRNELTKSSNEKQCDIL